MATCFYNLPRRPQLAHSIGTSPIEQPSNTQGVTPGLLLTMQRLMWSVVIHLELQLLLFNIWRENILHMGRIGYGVMHYFSYILLFFSLENCLILFHSVLSWFERTGLFFCCPAMYFGDASKLCLTVCGHDL